jgi:hypothetical protein
MGYFFINYCILNLFHVKLIDFLDTNKSNEFFIYVEDRQFPIITHKAFIDLLTISHKRLTITAMIQIIIIHWHTCGTFTLMDIKIVKLKLF